MKKILVILPTYNEASNITPIINDIFVAGKQNASYKYEVMVVDDNSPDGTGKQVEKMQKNNRAVHLLQGPRQGLGRAYLRGFKKGLLLSDYHAFVMMDADFSHDPQDIPKLLATIEQGYDYVIGSRYTKGGKTTNWPAARNFKSWLANTFARIMLDLKTNPKDLTGGFKAIRVSALKRININDIKAAGYVFQVNLLHEFSKRGFKITEVPIEFKNRERGKSKMRLSDILEFMYLTYTLNPDSAARRLIRFCFVGASGVAVNLVILVGLVQLFGVSPGIAYPVALEASILSNFILNHYYTFRAGVTTPPSPRHDKFGALVHKLFRYNLVALGGAGISFIVFYLLYGAGLHYVPSDLFAIIAATAWNYYMSVKVVWKLVDE